MALVTIKSGMPKNIRHIYLTMQSYQKEFVRIKEVLTTNPKGMTITDISRAINVNRNSVAKYLELLLLSGHVEMRSFGPAKVFFISHRVPLSAMLNFSSDYILVLNGDLKIVQVTDNLLDLMSLEREVLLGQGIEDISLPSFTRSEIMPHIKEALDGKDSSMELSLQMAEAEFCFKIKLIPTTFDNGEQGVTAILENITEQKRSEEQLEEAFKRERMARDISIIQRIIILLENANSMDYMLDTTVNELVKALQSEIGIIAKLDKDSQLEILKQIGLNETDANRKLSLKRIAVADEARIYNADEISKTVLQRLLPHNLVFSSIICPVHSNIVNGILILCRLYPEKFTERDLRVVSVVVASLEKKLRQDSEES